MGEKRDAPAERVASLALQVGKEGRPERGLGRATGPLIATSPWVFWEGSLVEPRNGETLISYTTQSRTSELVYWPARAGLFPSPPPPREEPQRGTAPNNLGVRADRGKANSAPRGCSDPGVVRWKNVAGEVVSDG